MKLFIDYKKAFDMTPLDQIIREIENTEMNNNTKI